MNMKVKIVLKLFIKNIFDMLCFIGCSYQVYSVVMSYLAYNTVSLSTYSRPDYIQYPRLHYCFCFLENALNLTVINKKYGLNVSNQEYDDLYRLIDTISLKDIFDYTPEPSMTDCTYRDPTGNAIVWTGKNCTNFFDMYKYVTQHYVCYVAYARKDYSILFRSVEKTSDIDRSLYQIQLNLEWTQVEKIKISITNSHFPFVETAYSPSYYKEPGKDVYIQASCINQTIHKLGYPYDHHTCVDDINTYYECLDYCIEQQSIRSFDRLPFSSFYPPSFNMSHMKLIGNSMLQNETIRDTMNYIYLNCTTKCPVYACVYSYCLIESHINNYSPWKSDISSSKIVVESTGQPYYNVHFVPQVPFLDSMIYILSTLGIWFGLVIVSCNPIRLIDQHFPHFFQNDVNRNVSNFTQNRIHRHDLYIHRMLMRSNYYLRYNQPANVGILNVNTQPERC